MKARLTFDLDDPEDRQAHLRCTKALDMALVLWELAYNRRKQWLNRHDDSQDAVEEICEDISSLISEHGIDINDLIS